MTRHTSFRKRRDDDMDSWDNQAGEVSELMLWLIQH